MGGKPYVQSWRTTANALEATAAKFNDSLLILDEISQSSPKEIDTTFYMLANEHGKNRMTASATERPGRSWRVIVLSTGEKDLAAHINEGGKTVRGGHMVRCLDIPSDSGAGMGLFEDIHGATNADEFAQILQNLTMQYYGSAFPAFMEKIITFPTAKDDISKGTKKFATEVTPPNASGEVLRAIQRFALVAAAGEIASGLGITGWKLGESLAAAKKCFKAWLEHRGDTVAGDVSY